MLKAGKFALKWGSAGMGILYLCAIPPPANCLTSDQDDPKKKSLLDPLFGPPRAKYDRVFEGFSVGTAYLDSLQTGDLIFFTHASTNPKPIRFVLDKLTRYANGVGGEHVGFILRHPSHDYPYVVEHTWRGVQVTPFEDRVLNTTCQDVMVRTLHVFRDAEFDKKALQFVEQEAKLSQDRPIWFIMDTAHRWILATVRLAVEAFRESSHQSSAPAVRTISGSAADMVSQHERAKKLRQNRDSDDDSDAALEAFGKEGAAEGEEGKRIRHHHHGRSHGLSKDARKQELINMIKRERGELVEEDERIDEKRVNNDTRNDQAGGNQGDNGVQQTPQPTSSTSLSSSQQQKNKNVVSLRSTESAAIGRRLVALDPDAAYAQKYIQGHDGTVSGGGGKGLPHLSNVSGELYEVARLLSKTYARIDAVKHRVLMDKVKDIDEMLKKKGLAVVIDVDGKVEYYQREALAKALNEHEKEAKSQGKEGSGSGSDQVTISHGQSGVAMYSGDAFNKLKDNEDSLQILEARTRFLSSRVDELTTQFVKEYKKRNNITTKMISSSQYPLFPDAALVAGCLATLDVLPLLDSSSTSSSSLLSSSSSSPSTSIQDSLVMKSDGVVPRIIQTRSRLPVLDNILTDIKKNQVDIIKDSQNPTSSNFMLNLKEKTGHVILGLDPQEKQMISESPSNNVPSSYLTKAVALLAEHPMKRPFQLALEGIQGNMENKGTRQTSIVAAIERAKRDVRLAEISGSPVRMDAESVRSLVDALGTPYAHEYRPHDFREASFLRLKRGVLGQENMIVQDYHLPAFESRDNLLDAP